MDERTEAWAGATAIPAPRRGHGTRDLRVLLAVTFLAFINYAALLAVVPLWASRLGGGRGVDGGPGSIAVGATTGAMMAATVLTQLGLPRLFRMLPLRTMLMLGAALLGLPAPLYAVTDAIAPVLVITVVRGVGFALVVVAGSTLLADVAGRGRLASASSFYGAAAALPNLAALAGGVWVAHTWSFDIVFVTAGAAGVLAAIVACPLPKGIRGTFHLASVARLRTIAGPVGLFLLTAGAFGAVTTFLPVTGPEAGTTAVALLGASAALIAARLGAGAIGDRIGTGRVLAPAAGLGALGAATLALSLEGPEWTLVLGATLLGAGFGAAQNDSFVIAVQRLGAGHGGTGATIWNIAYDGGLGLGAMGLGLVVGHLGYAQAFIALGSGIAFCALLALRPGAGGVLTRG
ncbi:MFS transporter [Occultella glacieicola]|uniref:MFS transporter n=1 Tax=Occultella glacieicola TaxID=2518684 RepID=A0ABY2E2F5_9MICO|nr:MFS transporter [Occultella glacieicola]TDE89941.1 MFS transporter [Occultella glacieicola]